MFASLCGFLVALEEDEEEEGKKRKKKMPFCPLIILSKI